MKYDVNRWRGLAQQWKDKCYHLEQSQQKHETREYLKLLEKHRRQSKELERTKARVWQLEKQVYGRKTEKKPVKKARLWNLRRRRRRKSAGRSAAARVMDARLERNWCVKLKALDVAPEDQVCDSCGAAYVPMSDTDNSEILENFTKAHIREIRRKKYAKTCNCRQTAAVVTAKPAPRVIAKGLLGVSVWVEILLSKYWYSRSTCNLLRQMRDQGMAISQGTVTDGLKKMAPWFEPLLDQLMQRQMEDSVFHCDETGWKVYEKMEEKVGNRWYLWVFESASSVMFRSSTSVHCLKSSRKCLSFVTVTVVTSDWRRSMRRSYWPFAGFICGGIISKLRCSSRNWSGGCSSGGSALARSITSMRVVRSISMSRGRWLSKVNHSCSNSSGLSTRSSRWSGL